MITAGSQVTLPDGTTYEVIGDPEDFTTGPFSAEDDFPTPFTVTVSQPQPGNDDGHGNAAQSFGVPEQVPVHGWGPANGGAAKEPKVAGHDQVITDLELFVPPLRVVNLRRIA